MQQLGLSPASQNGEELFLAGVCLTADISGALYWPAERTLAVADLHLEKGSSLAARGVMLPPYDTAVTLAKLAAAVARYNPLRVIALGDSFHDREGGTRLTAESRAVLLELQHGRDWLWISGNHDPERIANVGGKFRESLRIGPLSFRHQPSEDTEEIVGHFHPVARVSVRGRSLRRRCFASSRQRIVMPAFGSLTGGFNVCDPVYAEVLGRDFFAHLLGDTRIFRLAASACLPD